MRAPLALLGVLLVALVAASVGESAAKPKPLRVQIAFSGTATGRLQDVERWILLDENECYLRRTREQQVQLSFAGSWTGIVGKALRLTATGGSGTVSGAELRDSCDEQALPPDAPADWIASIRCSDPVAPSAMLTASWAGTAARPTLEVNGPTFSLSPDAICSAVPRTTELFAHVPLAGATLAKLAAGKSLVIGVGTAQTRYGDYTPQANCQHNAKPYDGYRSEDACADAFSWSGQLRITRIR